MGSRPSESRNDLLNRWIKLKREERFLRPEDKPTDPGKIMTLQECEKWRKRLGEELNTRLNKLYREPLPETDIRYINDDCNKRVREIRRWELRIIELGGIDYASRGSGMKLENPDGTTYSVNTNSNEYQYFGRARQLPGVKEILEAEKKDLIEPNRFAKKINKNELMEKVDSEYYGLDDDEKLLIEEEAYLQSIGVDTSDSLPIVEPGPIPSDESVRDALFRIGTSQDQKVIVSLNK